MPSNFIIWRQLFRSATGKVTAEIARTIVENEYEKFRVVNDRLKESDFDGMLKLSRYKKDYWKTIVDTVSNVKYLPVATLLNDN